MKIHILTFIAILCAPPAFAQQSWAPPSADAPAEADPEDNAGDGMDLIERGTGMLLENLMNRAAPHLDGMGQDLSDGLSMMAPALGDLAKLVDDIGNYQTPERLENGDIIIRRNADAPPPPPVGNSLRGLTEPDRGVEPPSVPVNPYAPELEL